LLAGPLYGGPVAVSNRRVGEFDDRNFDAVLGTLLVNPFVAGTADAARSAVIATKNFMILKRVVGLK